MCRLTELLSSSITIIIKTIYETCKVEQGDKEYVNTQVFLEHPFKNDSE
jgi:hypothetical protein